MNLKVMLVDDEPIITCGLQKLIDWEAEGYEIAKTAINGVEAIEYLKSEPVDLIITDIRMPEMDGLEMIKQIREKALSDAYIVLLSGYGDFGFAKQAIKYGCTDYILKPIQEKALVDSLRSVAAKKQITIKRQEDRRRLSRIDLENNLRTLLKGKEDRIAAEYVRSNMRLSVPIHFVHVSLDDISSLKELADDEVYALKKKLFEACASFLGDNADHLLHDIYGLEETYDVGLVYCDYMALDEGITMEEYLSKMQAYMEVYHPDLKVSLLVGKGVSGINKLSNSYSSACALRTLKGFKERKRVYYYEDEVQANSGRVMICKKSLDRLIVAIEQNKEADIVDSVNSFFAEMESTGTDSKTVSMNVNYLLFQLIHL
ncbi:MAG: response regulator, partial [Lachnospiraceae bacterium]|nr:response regulator [Lachnospiraceae bacterium]